jgi:hypothetical protein
MEEIEAVLKVLNAPRGIMRAFDLIKSRPVLANK